MKKVYLAIAVPLCLFITLAFSGCGPMFDFLWYSYGFIKGLEELDMDQYEEMVNGLYYQMQQFRVLPVDDEEYSDIEETPYYVSDYYADTSNYKMDALFIEREVRGECVRGLGFWPLAFDFVGAIDGSTRTVPLYIKIGSVYCPGTIMVCGPKYFNVHYINDEGADFRVFYCGRKTDLLVLGYGSAITYYVPCEQLEEYQELCDLESRTERTDIIKAANVEYRLNAEELEKYYYVDYVESGECVRNIPPEPNRKGYRFLGWYLDEAGVYKFDFDTPITAAEGESMPLFAKWEEE